MRPVMWTNPLRKRAEALKTPFSPTFPLNVVPKRGRYTNRTSPPGYCQRVERSQGRLRAVTSDFFREGQFSHVLAIELSRTLRPRDAPEPRAEQEAQSQAFRHSALPVQVPLAGCKRARPPSRLVQVFGVWGRQKCDVQRCTPRGADASRSKGALAAPYRSPQVEGSRSTATPEVAAHGRRVNDRFNQVSVGSLGVKPPLLRR
jgi:hypothetical protein